jgi:hypothetical protein
LSPQRYDYHLDNEVHNTKFYASMIVPLYMRCYDVKDLAVPKQIYKIMDLWGAFRPNENPENVQKRFYGVPTRYCFQYPLRQSANPYFSASRLIVNNNGMRPTFGRFENIQLILNSSPFKIQPLNYMIFDAFHRTYSKELG